jgi:hypothetical protein
VLGSSPVVFASDLEAFKCLFLEASTASEQAPGAGGSIEANFCWFTMVGLLDKKPTSCKTSKLPVSGDEPSEKVFKLPAFSTDLFFACEFGV